jgi:transcriptional regulator with XRE-family HTH domain
MLKPNQIVAARGLLGWSQPDLSARTGINTATISEIENRKSTPKLETLQAIQDAFDFEGLEFVNGGVQLKPDRTTYIDGEGWFLRLLEDVHHTLAKAGNSAELLVHAADDSKSPLKVIEKYREIRRAGIRMRQTVEEGNTYLMGPLEEYRYIPKAYFKNWVKLIYGGKVAISRANETGCMVIVDEDLAEEEKNQFNLLWGLLQSPKESTADERF